MYMRGDALALVTQVVKQSGVAWVTGWVFINMRGGGGVIQLHQSLR